MNNINSKTALLTVMVVTLVNSTSLVYANSNGASLTNKFNNSGTAKSNARSQPISKKEYKIQRSNLSLLKRKLRSNSININQHPALNYSPSPFWFGKVAVDRVAAARRSGQIQRYLDLNKKILLTRARIGQMKPGMKILHGKKGQLKEAFNKHRR